MVAALVCGIVNIRPGNDVFWLWGWVLCWVERLSRLDGFFGLDGVEEEEEVWWSGHKRQVVAIGRHWHWGGQM